MKITMGIALLGLSSLAEAAMVHVDPTLYAPGTDISTAFAGVTLSNVSIDPNGLLDPIEYEDGPKPALAVTPIYATECSPCRPWTEGLTVFGHGPEDGPPPLFTYANYAVAYFDSEYSRPVYRDVWNAFRAEFDQPTNYIELIGGGHSTVDYFRFDIFGTDGLLIATCVSGVVGGPCNGASLATLVGNDPSNFYDYARSPWSFSFSSDVDIAFITAGGWAGSQYVQSLAFNSIAVPTPGAPVYFILGLIAMAARRTPCRPHTTYGHVSRGSLRQ